MTICNLCRCELDLTSNKAHKGIIFRKATGHEAARMDLVSVDDHKADAHLCVTCLMMLEIALIRFAR